MNTKVNNERAFTEWIDRFHGSLLMRFFVAGECLLDNTRISLSLFVKFAHEQWHKCTR